jgi:uncharacterized protein YcfJ
MKGSKMSKNNAKWGIIGSAFFTVAGLAAGSAQAVDFEDYARVVSVTPQIEQINNPRQECRTEYETVQQAPVPQERGAGGAILGGIAGGVLGAQVGHGGGRTAATAVGAIAGALVGDRMENGGQVVQQQPSYETRPVKQCRQIDNWEQRTTGYSVTYEYQHRTYTTVLPYDPGNRLKLQVSLVPRI